MAQSAKEDKARGIVLISGNKYMTTAGRVMAIHEKYPGCVQISTKILNDDELKVEMMATVEITDETGTRKFTGFAREHYEVKTQKDVNYASALENCETSAVGRAIGFAGVGLLPESGFASADEIEGIDRKKKAVESQLNAKNKPEPVEENPGMKAIWELAQEKNVNANGLQALMAETLDTEVKDSSSLSTAQLKKVYDALKAKEVEVAL
jgi:hypothetical protein